MVFLHITTSSKSSKERVRDRLLRKLFSRARAESSVEPVVLATISAVAADTQFHTPTPLETVETFNMFSSEVREIILQGAPPAIGRLLPTRRPSGSNSATSSRPKFLSPPSSSSNSSGSLCSSSAPVSAKPTYPVLALLEVLKFGERHETLAGLDILTDAASLAQILRYQRTMGDGGSHGKQSPASSISMESQWSGSSQGRSPSRLGSRSRSRSRSSQRQRRAEPKLLRINAILEGDTLVLLSNLYDDLDMERDSSAGRLKSALESVTHSPLHGSDEHKRIIRYAAGGMDLVVHFTAHASLAKYNQPFIPVSHSPVQFPGSQIDYHAIPKGVSLPLDHELLVHASFDSPEDRSFALDEMTFSRVDKLMEISQGAKLMDSTCHSLNEVECDLEKGMSFVAPFLRQLRETMKEKKLSMVLLQQLISNDEIAIVDDSELLGNLSEALKNHLLP